MKGEVVYLYAFDVANEIKTDKIEQILSQKPHPFEVRVDQPLPKHTPLYRPLAIDLKRFSVTWRGQPVPLTLTEFWMVHALARHPGHVKNREQLMREANLVVDDGTVTSHVKRIRRKFQALDPGFGHIETAYGMGYRWKE